MRLPPSLSQPLCPPRLCGKSAWLLLVIAALMTVLPAPAAERLIYHDIRTDPTGRIVPWYGAGPPEAYDNVIRLVWNFWRTMRNCPNGVPYYMLH